MGVNKLDSMFPTVEWTGSSNIHKSWARGTVIEFPANKHDELMYLLAKQKVGNHIYHEVHKRFESAEFLVDEAQFGGLAMVDFSRHMRGLGDLASDQKLVNPFTGNQFHRIALAGDVVIAIRFWCDPDGDHTFIGFRVRVQVLDEDEERTRVRMRETLDKVSEEMEVIDEVIFDIKEPPQYEGEIEKLLMENSYAY